jgi:pyruvate kinase
MPVSAYQGTRWKSQIANRKSRIINHQSDIRHNGSMRRTKIVATIGPATSSAAAVSDLVRAGVDVFRLNFSHGTRDDHAQSIARIRAAADEQGRVVAVLQDLSGPKIRTGALRGGTPLTLNTGDEFHIVVGDTPGEPGRISTTYAELPLVVQAGSTLLLDDGRIQLRVEEASRNDVRTTVVDGGLLGERKGINVPGVHLPSAALTPKDITDLQFGVSAGVDFIALSFVQSAADVRQAREQLHSAGAPHIPLIAKLERPAAVEHIDEILVESDAVMVARGDLGLELPLEQVPRVQKDVTRRARALGIPVILATQVLESMRAETRPTRAEVSDAANAVDQGVDAIMLAGETAIGLYPIRAVQTLDAIIRDAETMPAADVQMVQATRLLGGHGRAICEAAVTLAARGNAAAIVAVTRGGKTARLLAALRPRAPIFAATDDPAIARHLALAWGVVPVLSALDPELANAASRIGQALVDGGAIARGSTIVLVSITPDLSPGPSNFLKLQKT